MSDDVTWFQVYESSPHLWWWGSAVRMVQASPQVQEQLLVPDTPVDEMGGIFGTIIEEGGRYRMWYNAWAPEDDSYRLTISHRLAYAESEDGVEWRKPDLGLVEFQGSRHNHLTDLPFGGTTVFVDPSAVPERRYRAFGTYDSRKLGAAEGYARRAAGYGHFLAHSADGFHWEIDSDRPAFVPGDTATACWDPTWNCARFGFRQLRRYGGLTRRDIYTAEERDGVLSQPYPILIPDDYDDLVARRYGGISCDYYHMAWMPQPELTFGLLSASYHDVMPQCEDSGENWPVAQGAKYPMRGGPASFTALLAWQERSGGAWRRFPGHAPFLSMDPALGSYGESGYYVPGCVADIGDEHWMTISGNPHRHADVLHGSRIGPDRARDWNRRNEILLGLARWPRGRTLGAYTDNIDDLEVRFDGEGIRPGTHLRLNARTFRDGGIRVGLYDTEHPDNRGKGKMPIDGFGPDDCQVVTGDGLDQRVVWRGGQHLPAVNPDFQLAIGIELDSAAVYQVGLGA